MKKFSQCRKLSHSAENTLLHFLIHTLHNLILWLHILIHALTILIHWLSFRLSVPYLNKCINYLNTLSRLSAPYINTCIAYLNTLTRLSAPYPNTLNRHDSSRQHPRQPIRFEYYVIQVVSQSQSSITSPESSRLGVRTLLDSWLAIAYLNTLESSPLPHLLTLLLLTIHSIFTDEPIFTRVFLLILKLSAT